MRRACDVVQRQDRVDPFPGPGPVTPGCKKLQRAKGDAIVIAGDREMLALHGFG
jgi:hypothetical protein